ncbi:hypothetical protein H4582DRAFT_1902451 [Lactarius indigo]|nr:hypothetical protein H4582DRAFT_1902451 [Lactarius indigo]
MAASAMSTWQSIMKTHRIVRPRLQPSSQTACPCHYLSHGKRRRFRGHQPLRCPSPSRPFTIVSSVLMSSKGHTQVGRVRAVTCPDMNADLSGPPNRRVRLSHAPDQVLADCVRDLHHPPMSHEHYLRSRTRPGTGSAYVWHYHRSSGCDLPEPFSRSRSSLRRAISIETRSRPSCEAHSRRLERSEIEHHGIDSLCISFSGKPFST